MSKYAPSNGDSTPLVKFGEMECLADGPFTAKNGVQFYKVTVNITPFVDPNNIPANADEMKVRTWKMVTAKWNQEFTLVFWDSITADNRTVRPHLAIVVNSPDDIFSVLGEPTKRFYISYQTPLLLVPANADDIQYAKDHDRLESLVLNSLGQAQKKRYPPKIVNFYATREAWEADALKNAPAPSEVQPVKTQSNPEYAAALSALPIFVERSNLDLTKLEASLQAPPLNIYFNINSKEVKHEVAKAVIAKTGPTDDNAIKGMLLSFNGYLDIESPEIIAARESVPF